MNRGLLLGVVACVSSWPACAGDKPAPGLVADSRAVLLADARLSAPLQKLLGQKLLHSDAGGARMPAPVLPRVAVFTLDARAAPAQLLTAAPRGAAPLAATGVRPQQQWRVPGLVSSITGLRAGSDAVRETLATLRLRGGPRSPLKTMFVLRIDGQEDSPPFSIGGGGVAAALWRVGQSQ